MRVIYEIFKIVIGVGAGASLFTVFKFNLDVIGSSPQTRDVELSYADLAAINLTVATVVLAAVGLIVGIVAVFGFQIIRSESISNAEKRVLEEMPKILKLELRRMEKDGSLGQAMERIIYSGGAEDDDGSMTSPEK